MRHIHRVDYHSATTWQNKCSKWTCYFEITCCLLLEKFSSKEGMQSLIVGLSAQGWNVELFNRLLKRSFPDKFILWFLDNVQQVIFIGGRWAIILLLAGHARLLARLLACCELFVQVFIGGRWCVSLLVAWQCSHYYRWEVNRSAE